MPIRTASTVASGLLFLVAVAVVGCASPSADRSAEEILRLAEAAYASADTYRDRGISTVRMVAGNGVRDSVTTVFTTAFQRPSDFRMTYRSSEETLAHAILATSAGTETWVEGAEIPLPFDSIADALRGTNAPSGGASILIPPLLFPGVGRAESLLNLTEVTRDSEAEAATEERHVIRGKWHGRSVAVWFDRQSHMVVRFEIVHEQIGPEGMGRAEQSVVLEPEVDRELPAEVFREGIWELDG